MSDNWLNYVPVDPDYIPSREAADRAVALLKQATLMTEGVEGDFPDDVVFVEPGSNWEGVECHLCGADAESWWSEAMDSAWRNPPINLSVITRCCGASVSLNDLRYRWPAGFGRFVLTVTNPRNGFLTGDEESALATCLGCDLRKVWRHF